MQEQKRTFKYGDVFHVAGLDWIVLRTTPAPTPGRSDLHFCEATEDVFQAPFDENDCNDWNKASLRKQLNGEFLDKLIAECPSLKDAIVPTYRDLTADDGLRDYGNCLDNVTMLTADEYRQTRDLHPAPEHWRWLITPDGTSKSSGTSFVRYVYSDGSLYHYLAYDGRRGVRPALNLTSWHLSSTPRTRRERQKSGPPTVRSLEWMRPRSKRKWPSMSRPWSSSGRALKSSWRWKR